MGLYKMAAPIVSVRAKPLIFANGFKKVYKFAQIVQQKHLSSLNVLVRESDLLKSDDKSPCILTKRFGHKMYKDLTVRKNNPMKIETYEYSGDLRTLPNVSEDSLIYDYKGLVKEIGSDEFLKKLASIKFAKKNDKIEHKREMIRDRMIEIFGPDSELEQEIALKTLTIRQMIPYCIKHRHNKQNRVALEKHIISRRNMLTSLREMDHERFEWLLRELKIQYVIPRDAAIERGWKEQGIETAESEVLQQQREKLAQLKEEYVKEKEAFFDEKEKILAKIDQDLADFGLDRSYFKDLLQREKEEEIEAKKEDLTWEERVKIGMIDVKHLFPPKPMDPRLVKKYEKLAKKNKKR